MVILFPHPKRSWAIGHDMCPSTPEKVSSVVMAIPIPLLEGRREGGHGLRLSPLVKRRRLPTFTFIPHREGRLESGLGICPAIPEKVRSVAMATPHPSSRRKEGKGPWPLPFSA